jgi:hypothetical protein
MIRLRRSGRSRHRPGEELQDAPGCLRLAGLQVLLVSWASNAVDQQPFELEACALAARAKAVECIGDLNRRPTGYEEHSADRQHYLI